MTDAQSRQRPAWWPLVATRLRPPVVRAPMLARERLCLALDESSDVALMLVHAPAGFGKTTLLVQWYQRALARGRPVAWVSLEEIDHTADRFLALVSEAIRIALPSMSEALDRLVSHAVETPPALRAARLLAELEQQDRDLTLVVDDLRGCDAALVSLLNALVDGAGNRLHVVIACREIPPLALARLRMRKALADIDARDLQFRRDEAVSFLTTIESAPLTQDQASELWSRTDGWIAGLQLALLSLRRQGDPERLLMEFSGQHRDIGDLLAQEVLDKLDTGTVDFLLRTSIAMALNAELCNALTGRTDSQEMLQRLEREGLFLLPLDETRHFYRFHAMFSEFLQRQLDAREPGAASRLHRVAARWHEARGFAVRAAEHALRAGDPHLAGEMLDAAAAELASTGRGGTLLALAARIPPAVANDYPTMQLQRAYALTLAWDFDQAAALLQGLRLQLADADVVARWEARGVDQDAVYRDIVHCEAQLALLRDDMGGSTRLTEEWLALPGEKSTFDLAVAKTSIIYGRREQYDCSSVDAAPEIRKLFADDNKLWATVWHDTIIGACYLHSGDLPAAERLYRRAMTTATTVSGPDSPTTAMAALYLAELLYELDQRQEATELSARYLSLGGETGLVDQLVAGYVTRARLDFLQRPGDPSAALETIAHGLRLAHAKRFERLQAHLLAEQIRILLLVGDARQAHRVARANDLAGAGERFRPRRGATTAVELQALAWAQVALSRDQVVEAIDVLERWVKFAEARQARRTQVRCGLLLSVAALRSGDVRRARRLLRGCLVAGRPGGFVRSFVDAGEPVRDLLATADEARGPDDAALGQYQSRLLSHFRGLPAAPAAAAPVQPCAEALGPRELEVLAMVARGYMNSQIADELGLTVGTVKWYMQQIFAKLGARRRAEAIHRARQVGLIA